MFCSLLSDIYYTLFLNSHHTDLVYTMVKELAALRHQTNPCDRGRGDISDQSDVKPFNSEQELVDTFGDIANRKNKDDTGLVYELDAGNGIADIVFFQMRSNW